MGFEFSKDGWWDAATASPETGGKSSVISTNRQAKLSVCGIRVVEFTPVGKLRNTGVLHAAISQDRSWACPCLGLHLKLLRDTGTSCIPPKLIEYNPLPLIFNPPAPQYKILPLYSNIPQWGWYLILGG